LQPKGSDKDILALTPWAVLQAAVKAVPALKFALGVLGIVAAIAIVRAFGIDFQVAVFGTIIMLVLMAALVVFAALTRVKSPQVRAAALVMMWSFLALTILSAALLFTSAFFNLPKPIKQLFDFANPPGPSPAPAGTGAYDVIIADVEKEQAIEDRRMLNATLLFNKAVPNGQATMELNMKDGRKVYIFLWPVNKDPDGKRVDRGQPTTRLEAEWPLGENAVSALDLEGQSVRVYSYSFPPDGSSIPSSIPCAKPFESEIVSVTNIKAITGRDAITASLVLRDPVPNSEGTIRVALGDGRTVRLFLFPVVKEPEGKPISLGALTSRLHVQWSPKRERFTESNLIGRKALLYFRDYFPITGG
jgi:hypothetical protein